MPPRIPITVERLDAVLDITPAPEALEILIREVPHVPIPGRRFNRTQVLLNLVYAVDASFGSIGLALFIDYGTGAEYDTIVDVLDEIGASITCSYLKEGREIVGGIVPTDESERAALTEQHDRELRTLDLKYRDLLRDEAAKAFLAWLAKDKARAVIELNQISP